MKIVLLSTSDITGGAAIVSVRLVEAFRQLGHEARMLVLDKRGDHDYVHQFEVNRSRFPFYAERLEIFLNNGFNRSDLFKVSTASAGKYVTHHRLIREADVILLGYINQGYLSLKEIDRLASMGKPVIWTMHDQWCMTGICHLAGSCDRFTHSCGDCPLLHGRRSSHDLSHKVWKKKERLYTSHPDLRFVVVSSWLAEQAMRSSLLHDRKVTVIPNAIEIPSLPALNTSSRENTIVMGAARLDEDVKNLSLAINALNHFMEAYGESIPGVEALFFGNLRNPRALDDLKMPHTWRGPVKSNEVLDIMNRSRVVLSTSHFEMLPTTIVEGLAWGCVVVATDSGGQSDIIENGVNGFLVQPTPESVAKGIRDSFTLQVSPRELRESVAMRYSPATIASQYLKFAQSLSLIP